LALRFLLLFILAYLVFLFIKVFFSSSKNKPPRSLHERVDKEEVMVLDPQCQSYLPRNGAIFSHGYYFCSEECAHLFVRTIEGGDSTKS
jgi:YHS domain-containing protein